MENSRKKTKNKNKTKNIYSQPYTKTIKFERKAITSNGISAKLAPNQIRTMYLCRIQKKPDG